jgi:RNA polymerase sigma-70 factor (ECF subfamily)
MNQPPSSANNRFPTTQWTLVGRLHHPDEAIVRRALDELCAQYHFPLYCYIRSRGLNHSDAEDALHDFLAKLLRNHSLQSADPEKGRLRSFLAAGLRNFLIDWNKQHQRDGKLRYLRTAEIEARYLQEIQSSNENPETIFDRKWAHTLIHRAIESLAGSYSARGKSPLFEALLPILLAGGSLRGEDTARLAATVGLKENTLRVGLHRLLREFRQGLEEEVLQTVSSPAEARSEILHLMNVLRHS